MASAPPSPSDGTSSESVVTRGGFRLLRRTQTVRRTVEEVYLRDDIACGSALCSACAHLESDPALPPPLCADATHFAVPDARALAENVDAFLAAAVPGAGDVVLLASELREAHARGDARLSRALRAFTADPRHARGVKLFPNEHFRATSVVVGERHRSDPRRRNAVVAARDGRAFAELPASAAGVAARAHAVLRAAGWYAAHVANEKGIPVVVVTDDEALLALRAGAPAATPPGVVLSPPREYFAAFRPGSLALAERERVEARRRDAEEAERAWRSADEGFARAPSDPGGAVRAYANHLSAREAAEGLRAGTLVRGTLRVRADAPDLAVVSAAASGGVGGARALDEDAGRREGLARSADPDANDDELVSPIDDDAEPLETSGGSLGARASSLLARGDFSDDGFLTTINASELDAVSFGTVRTGGDVLVPGRRARNRAFDGDEVAIRLFPPARWARGADAVAARAGNRGDDDDDDDDDENENGETGETGETGVGSGTARAFDSDDADSADYSAEEPLAPVPTGEVVAILRPRGADFVATVSAEDAEEIERGGFSGARNSVLAVPADRRLPKVRLLTRHASELIRKRLLVRVERWPRHSRHPEARVLRVLGPAGDAATETAAVLLEHDILDAPFSPGAMAELPPSGAAWRVPPAELGARVDARAWRVMSIDPPGCVDVDDAIGVRRIPRARAGPSGPRDPAGFSLHEDGAPGTLEITVHIADVGFFVPENSLLDVEARARGTTTYLVDRRIDMLPELLSADLASLVRGKERLAMFCAFELDPETFAVQKPPRFGRSVIRSRHQLDYYQAQALLDRASPPTPVGSIGGSAAETEAVARDLDALARFAEALREARVARGAVELSSAELRFETSADAGVGEQLGVTTKSRVERKKEVPMMRVVAELMIAANAAVATEIARAQTRTRGGPALLRKHEPPPFEKFEELRVALRENAGTELDASSGKALAASLDLAEARAADPGAGAMFRSLAARAMSEAQYVDAGDVLSDADDGSADDAFRGAFAHYGLALPLYTHFTSPIRRYADLVVHRQLWRALRASSESADASGRTGLANEAGARLELSRTARHLNARTRAAKVAQRRSVELRLTRALREAPAFVPAMVRSVAKQGVSLFVPSLHVQVFARVLRRDGGCALPRTSEDAHFSADSKEDFSADADPRIRRDATTRVVFDGGVKALAFVARGGDGGERELCRLRCGARAWVRLSASGGETRAARVECELLDASHPEARRAEPAEAAAEATRRVGAMRIDERLTPATDALETKPPFRDHTPRAAAGAAAELNMSTGEEEALSSAERDEKGDEKKKAGVRDVVPENIAATFARLLGNGDARRRAPGDTSRAVASGSGPSRPWTAPALVTHYAYDRRRSAAFRRARSAFVAARAAAAARAMAAAGTRFGGGEDGEARRARRKRRAAAADLRADAMRRAMEAARED